MKNKDKVKKIYIPDELSLMKYINYTHINKILFKLNKSVGVGK